VILKAREAGQFKDLNDFAHRADLRQVGKRALESLIRVGAMDNFGSRIALLEGIDRIISVSTAHFRAKEMGQMSLFGAHSGVVENISLPGAPAEIGRREVLNWERELIGLYVSDHPLSPVMSELTQAVTHFSGQLHEAAHQEHVQVAGMVVRIRPHQTKTGKSMAFVAIEDLQGTIETVIFPKVWERVGEMIEFDKIVLVDGKVDSQGGEPKVLVDQITTDFTVVRPVEILPMTKAAPEPVSEDLDEIEPVELAEAEADPPTREAEAIELRVASALAHPELYGEDDMPPAPDAFPDEWATPEMGSLSLGALATMMFAADKPSDAPSLVKPAPEDDLELEPAPATPVLGVAVAVAGQNPEPSDRPVLEERLISAQQYLVSPIQPEGSRMASAA
jgi:DNA polymerase-3 subunit alpha